MDYDALIIGAGIAGMESAISLGDMGYKVLLVEKEPSIGGKMILLSKVFPTLDCASCISTPKMALAASHPNIDLKVFSEVRDIRGNGAGGFRLKLQRKATFVDPVKCTGCQDCEKACTVTVPDQYNFDLVSRRAAHIAFPQAVPKKAIIERSGTSPCTFACPTGIKANGYISLARRGDFEKAFHLILEDAPLVASLGRACYAPCQTECTREKVGDAPHIKLLKRFIADRYYARHAEPEYGPAEKISDKKIAVVGSGPAGLTAAYFLARRGYPVTIFEAAPLPGGMLRSGLPSYRLPKDVVDRDIKNVTALGVEIRTGTRVDSVRALLEEGYAAAFVAVGAAAGKKLRIAGEEHPDVIGGIDLLERINRGDRIDLQGKTVLVIGGGNVAIDVARAARRLHARAVHIVCLEKRAAMPAAEEEVLEALAEGILLHDGRGPQRILSDAGRLTGLETVACLSVFDDQGRFAPRFKSNAKKTIAADAVFVAIGQDPTSAFLGAEGFVLNRNRTLQADPETLMTSLPGVFAGGEAVMGPAMIVKAMGQGKRAAFFMDRWLQGLPLSGADYAPMLPVIEREAVLARQAEYPGLSVETKEQAALERIADFREVQLPLSEAEALASASNCLNCGICSECQECRLACPAGAIDFSMRSEEKDVEAGAVILASGFRLFPAERLERYGFGKFKNVITAMQMDRLVSPTRPYNHVLRPGDGKSPGNIAYVFCAGSRDQTADNSYCSRVCCMYSMKQAQLLLGALPVADVTLYYIDIRAYGKGYDEFAEQTKAMGVRFVKGRVAKIKEKENGDLIVRYEDIENGGVVRESEHDLVVLSVGLVGNPEFQGLFSEAAPSADAQYFIHETEEMTNPGQTGIAGVFAAGTATGPLDIPDTILHSGAAAVQAAAYIEKNKRNA
jgi:heterodisulfide reductase subunit A-like polyferredoxin